MALGQQLREARERHGLTASQVAAATRMKTQIVEAIEREDFGKIAAPFYGKGFIKLYAELVGIDSGPLLQEYLQRLSAATKTPSLVSEGAARRRAADPSHAVSGTAPVPPAATPLRSDESHVQLVADEDAAALAASTPATLDDPDLFSHATRRRQEVRQPALPSPPVISEPMLPQKAPPATPPSSPRSATVESRAPSAATPPSSPRSATAESRAPSAAAPAAPTVGWSERLAAMDLWQSPIRAASIVLGLVLLILLVISTLSRCVVSPKPGQGSLQRTELQVVVQPPEPYFE